MDFQTDVLDKSQVIPVLVDFWAPWCGPCKTLGPILDEVATENADSLELVKINTEDHPDLAQQFQITSIPHVKLFFKGEILNEFSGALTKHQINNWLKDYLPKAGNEELEYLLSTVRSLPDPDLVTKLKLWIEDNPDNEAAAIELAKHIVWESPEEIESILSFIDPSDNSYEQAANFQSLAEFLLLEFDEGHPSGAKLIAAQEHLKALEFESGIKCIIDAVSIDKAYHDDMPRLIGISFFNYFGTKHPLTIEHRKLFDMMIW